MKTMSDILIIGAGITGCCIARELSAYDATVLVLEKEEGSGACRGDHYDGHRYDS